MIRLHATGDWPVGAVSTRWADSSRLIVREVESAIDLAWTDAKARLGDKLFDGPMCRLEAWNASPQRLELTLSHTSYRPFLGTNLLNPQLADRFGNAILANPVGVSTALETADGWLLLGRRNDSVAYYPNRVHPFAGALEPAEPLDVFNEVRRELREELDLAPDELVELACTGMAEDVSLRQPELVFRALTRRTRAQIERTLDHTEHHAVYPIAANERDAATSLADPILTPIAVATTALWGRRRFGRTWFERHGVALFSGSQ